MAEKKKETVNKQIPEKVVVLSDHRCKFVECKKKSEKADFCQEHFNWFKAGLITKNGEKALDFEKKYSQFVSKKAG